MKFLLALALLALCRITWSQSDLKNIVTELQMDSLFADWDHPDRPGIAVGAVSNGEIVMTKGYGSANLEHEINITSKTKFLVSELANQFVAFSLLMLEEEKQLSLKDKVTKYIPGLPSWGNNITLEHLLHHNSGLNDLESIKEVAGWHGSDIINEAQSYDLIKKQARLVSDPGETHQFNPTGMFLLEEVIKSVTGMPYVQYVSEHIFTPLGMSNTLFRSTPGMLIPNKAEGYFRTGTGYEKPVAPQPFANQAHLYSTVEDMCKWLQNFHSPTVGSMSVIEKFDRSVKENNVEMPQVNISMKVGQHRYWNFFGTKKLYLVGMSGGYSCKLIRFPDYDFGCVVLGNTRAYNGFMGSSAASLYINKYFASAESATENTEQVATKVSNRELEKYEGFYWGESNYLTRRIILRDDTLRYVRIGSDFESALLPKERNEFFMYGQNGVTVSFNLGENGSKQMVFSSQSGEPTSIMKYFDHRAAWTNRLEDFVGTYHSDQLDTYYTVSLEDDDLVFTHKRRSKVKLLPNFKDSFGTDNHFFSKISFYRGKDQKIEHLIIEHPGIENIQFTKINEARDNS